MAPKNTISPDEITFLKELCEEIRKYQGVSEDTQDLFGIEYDFMERVNLDSVTIIRNPGWIIVTGKTCDYEFEIQQFGSVLSIEKSSKAEDINIIRFADKDSNVCTNSIVTEYKANDILHLKKKGIIGRVNGSLLCGCDGTFIREELFWDVRESLVNDKCFEPFVRYEIFQALDNKTILRKSTESFEGRLFGNYYGKYTIRETLGHQKELVSCGNISEEMYCDLLEGSSFFTKQEEVKPKQKLKDRLFKHKA